MRNKLKLSAGFTLIEVLIALAILAIALVAVIKIAGQSVRDATKLKEKIAAHWVAMNALARAQTGLIDLKKNQHPSGTEVMFGEEWQWQITPDTNAESSSYARVTVTVHASHHSLMSQTLHGFVRFINE